MCANISYSESFNPNILHISFMSPFLEETLSANMIKLFSSSKEFRRLFFERRFCSFKMVWFAFYCEYLKLLPLFPKAFLMGNIEINILVVVWSFSISNSTCCICVYKIYISNRFIRVMISAIVQYFSWNTSQKTESTYPVALVFRKFVH